MSTAPGSLQDLKRRLGALRQAWPQAWVGLPAVLHESLDLLALAPRTSAARALLACARDAAALAEANGHAAWPASEPQYHNRLHFADATQSLAVLLRLQRQGGDAQEDEWTCALMLAVVAHDLLHPGGINGHEGELESRSVEALQPLLAAHAVPAPWPERVRELILRTDPLRVEANHQAVAGRPFEWTLDWACVLLNEADILASCLPEFGPALGQALAHEWAGRGLHAQALRVGSPEGRQDFLAAARFSSPASARLGMRVGAP